MVEIDEYTSLKIDFKKEYWLLLRKSFWKLGVSPNAFFGYMIKLVATGDPRVHTLMVETKKALAEKEDISNIARVDEQSLYNLIEFGLENKRKKT